MTHLPPQIIVEILIQDGIVSRTSAKAAWPGYVQEMPDENNNAVCVYGTMGTLDARDPRTGEVVRHNGIQIIVRGLDDPTGAAKAEEINQKLAVIKRRYVGVGSRQYRVNAAANISEVIRLGQEKDRSRVRFTMSCLVSIEEIGPTTTTTTTSTTTSTTTTSTSTTTTT